MPNIAITAIIFFKHSCWTLYSYITGTYTVLSVLVNIWKVHCSRTFLESTLYLCITVLVQCTYLESTEYTVLKNIWKVHCTRTYCNWKVHCTRTYLESTRYSYIYGKCTVHLQYISGKYTVHLHTYLDSIHCNRTYLESTLCAVY